MPCCLLHPKTIIQRPDAKLFDISNVIKVDQYETWHQKFVDKLGTLTVLKSLANARSFETIKDWGEKLMSEHKPANLLQLPPFIEKALSQPATMVQQPKARPTPKPADMRPNTRTSDASPAVTAKPAELDAVGSPMTGGFAQPGAKRLLCNHCGNKITYEEGKFCWAYASRFGDTQYCREHQGLFPVPRN